MVWCLLPFYGSNEDNKAVRSLGSLVEKAMHSFMLEKHVLRFDSLPPERDVFTLAQSMNLTHLSI